VADIVEEKKTKRKA